MVFATLCSFKRIIILCSSKHELTADEIARTVTTVKSFIVASVAASGVKVFAVVGPRIGIPLTKY